MTPEEEVVDHVCVCVARVSFGRAAAIFLSRCQRRVSEFIIIIILAVVIVARILSMRGARFNNSRTHAA